MKAFILVILLFLSSCGSTGGGDSISSVSSKIGKKIYVVGTDDYRNHVRNLKLDKFKARDLLAKHLRKSGGSVVTTGIHHIVVGNEYVFTIDVRKSGIALEGFYVDGNTGKIRVVKDKTYIDY